MPRIRSQCAHNDVLEVAVWRHCTKRAVMDNRRVVYQCDAVVARILVYADGDAGLGCRDLQSILVT